MSAENKKFKSDVAKIGTHNGTFHCDEVLACYMLKQLPIYKDAIIVRSRDPKELEKCDIVVDVGGVFDVKNNLFDHHQKSFEETFSSLRPEFGDEYDIRLSSAGLVYTYFGEEVISNLLNAHKGLTISEANLKTIYRKTYESFIREIDGIDNGVPICDGEPRYGISTHLSARVGRLNPGWDCEDFNEYELFEKAMQLVGSEFLDKILYYSLSWLSARKYVIEAINDAKNVHESGEILELKRFCPWKDHLSELEIEYGIVGHPKYVIFTDRNDWRVTCVPNQPGSFICRKFIHKDWRGIRNEDLAAVCGVTDAYFVHATGFIGGAKSRDGVLQMAIKSLEG